MPKSDSLLLRRWPCWPGPYSRRLTGLLGRPKTFSPMRRSSLYLALLRLLICYSPIRVIVVPGIAPQDIASSAITASPGMRDQLRAAHLGKPLQKVKFSERNSAFLLA